MMPYATKGSVAIYDREVGCQTMQLLLSNRSMDDATTLLKVVMGELNGGMTIDDAKTLLAAMKETKEKEIAALT